MIIDPGLENNEISYTVSGYSLIDGEYVEMRPDSRGRFYSMTTDVHIGVSESGDRFIVYNARPGKVLLPADERAELAEIRLKEAESQVELAETRVELAKTRAELAKSRQKFRRNWQKARRNWRKPGRNWRKPGRITQRKKSYV